MPFTVDEVRNLHLKFPSEAQDEVISGLILEARIACENEIGRSLLPQTWEMAFPCFGNRLWLRRLPVVEIVSVKYIDQAGVEQTLAAENYHLDDSSDTVCRLALTPMQSWPTTYPSDTSVKIRYLTGYADAGAIPGPLKRWMLAQIAHWFKNREAVNVGNIVSKVEGYDFLLDPYRTEIGL